MAYTIKGTYLAVCNCALLCPCPVDGKPTGPGGQCTGAAVFHIGQGNLDDTDLSGVDFCFYNLFPSNLSAGNWKVGVVVDEGASDEQAQALEKILSGSEGGPFGEFAPLFGEYLGMERASVTFSDGDSPSASVSGRTEVSFEPARGPDGSPTVVRGAMFGFAPEYKVGKGSGSSNSFGLSFEANYGESADFEFSTEMAGEIHPRA